MLKIKLFSNCPHRSLETLSTNFVTVRHSARAIRECNPVNGKVHTLRQLIGGLILSSNSLQITANVLVGSTGVLFQVLSGCNNKLLLTSLDHIEICKQLTKLTKPLATSAVQVIQVNLVLTTFIDRRR